MRKLLVYIAVFLAAIAWLVLVEPVKAGGYYYPSYNYYQSYSYYTPIYKEVPYYKEYPIYKEVTVPRYVTVPLYSVYLDPNAYQQPQQQQAKAPCNGMSATNTTTHTSQPAATTSAPCAEATARVAKLEAQMDAQKEQMTLMLRIMANAGQPPVDPPQHVPVKPGTPTPKTPPKSPSPAPKEPPPPPKAPKKPEVKEPTSAEVMQRGVNVLYTACARCHEEKVAKEHGENFVMFKGNTVVDLTERQWAKIERELTDDKMPPKKDKDGNVIAPLPSTDKKAILDMLVTRKTLVKAGEGG